MKNQLYGMSLRYLQAYNVSKKKEIELLNSIVNTENTVECLALANITKKKLDEEQAVRNLLACLLADELINSGVLDKKEPEPAEPKQMSRDEELDMLEQIAKIGEKRANRKF